MLLVNSRNREPGDEALIAMRELKEIARPAPKPASIGVPGRAEYVAYPTLVFTEMTDGLILSYGDLEIPDDDDSKNAVSMWLSQFPDITEIKDAEDPTIEILNVE